MMQGLIDRFMPRTGREAASALDPLVEEARQSHRTAYRSGTKLILAADDHRETMDTVRHRIERRCDGKPKRVGPDAILAATAAVADLARKHQKS